MSSQGNGTEQQQRLHDLQAQQCVPQWQALFSQQLLQLQQQQQMQQHLSLQQQHQLLESYRQHVFSIAGATKLTDGGGGDADVQQDSSAAASGASGGDDVSEGGLSSSTGGSTGKNNKSYAVGHHGVVTHPLSAITSNPLLPVASAQAPVPVPQPYSHPASIITMSAMSNPSVASVIVKQLRLKKKMKQGAVSGSKRKVPPASAAAMTRSSVSRASGAKKSAKALRMTSTGGVSTRTAGAKKKPQGPGVPSPVVFLLQLFSQSEKGKLLLKEMKAAGKDPSSLLSILFKPTDDMVSAYCNDVVHAVRDSDLPRLRQMYQKDCDERQLQHQDDDGAGYACDTAKQRPSPIMNSCNRFGESVLHMACRRGDVETVRFLVHEGTAIINRCDDYKRSPVHDTCWTSEPNFDVMDVLLSSPDMSPCLLILRDVRGHTPFHYARREHWDIWLQYLQRNKDTLQQMIENSSISSC